MTRGTPLPLLQRGIQAGAVAVALLAAPNAWAQKPELPHRLPPVSSIPLRADSFDVRAFDPFGLSALKDPAVAAATLPEQDTRSASPAEAGGQQASLAALDSGKAPAAGTGTGLFSDGWSRNGFGGVR